MADTEVLRLYAPAAFTIEAGTLCGTAVSKPVDEALTAGARISIIENRHRRPSSI